MIYSINVFAGSSCADDIDGCGDNPCTVGTNCTDLTPTQQAAQNKAFQCSDCPDGYIDDDGICVGSYEHISTKISWNLVICESVFLINSVF